MHSVDSTMTIKWIILIVVFSTWPVSTAITTINLGILLPRVADGNLANGLIIATEIAIKKVQDIEGILPRSLYTINFTEINTVCNELKAVEMVYKYRHLDAFIGPACSKECTSSGLLATTLNKPMISYSCSSLELSNRALYPTFARTRPYTRTYTDTTPLMIYELMKYRKWKRSCIISTEDEVWAPLATTIKKVLLDANMTVPYTAFYTPSSKLDYETVLLPVTKTCRIITFLAFSEEVAKLLWAADKMGMRNGEYAFITLDFNIEARYKNGSWPYVPKEQLFATFDGIINMAVGEPKGSEYQQTLKELTVAMTSKGLKIINQTLTFGVFIIDTIVLYAYGVNKTIENSGDYKDGKALISLLAVTKRLFTGASGNVGINANGNRVPLFVFSNRIHGKMVPNVIFDILKSPSDSGYITVLNDTVVIWPGGGTTVPSDEPRCGFDGEKCEPGDKKGLSVWYFMLLIIPFVLTILILVGFLYCRKKLFERDLLNSTWLICYGNLTFLSDDNRVTSRVRSRASLASSIGLGQYGKETNVGRYRGELVVIKKLRKENVHLTREMLIDMKKVRDTHHANLNPYLGVCVDSPDICIISLFCNRGCLQDILGNDDIKLEWMFRQSFANDIVSGMEALHSSAAHVHGNLKSTNCLIDSRWVCRIGDYGLDLLRENQTEKDCGDHAKYRDMLWMAPEHIHNDRKASKASLSSRTKTLCQYHTQTQSGDLYSFGIILYELVTRDEPYTSNMGTLTPKEIVDQVASHQIPPFRPQFPKSVLDLHDQRILHCVYECWDDDPSRRPSFTTVKKKLKLLNKGKNTNIVDNMLAMMEKYTDQLEVLVEERTKQLAEEKAKTDELLYKMLPRPIADQLKRGNAIAAESFTSCTIFFSDIVGFTSVAAQSTPFQVVDLLNALYTCFDKVVDDHDVYKVETIGDAYMIVSGLPVRNGNRHAGEIATTSLDLLSAVRDFQIPHIPTKKVQMRIGIHTGPCVAGVVGLKMPRYCLFGDTVNYASRMESSGLALRIHVSPECREVLDELGGYHIQERGPVTMKGKGTIITYFLLGKEGFNKPLPDLRYAVPLAEHEFK